MVGALQLIDELGASTYAFFYNHPDGHAASNAETVARLLRIPLRGIGHIDIFFGL